MNSVRSGEQVLPRSRSLAVPAWGQTDGGRDHRARTIGPRTQCPLTEYARGVALEFAVLMLTLCYVATFTLHDMRRLLDRPPRDQTSARGGVACAPTAIESVQPLSSAQLGLLSAAPP